jgi:hypothetical protein
MPLAELIYQPFIGGSQPVSDMSRSFLAFLAVPLALLVLAPVAAAQVTPGSAVTIGGLGATAPTNQTQVSLAFTISLSLNQGTCTGGGATNVAFTATKTGSNVTIEVQPPSLSFPIGPTSTASGKYTTSGGGSLVIKTTRLLRENMTVAYTLNAAPTTTCMLTGVGMAGTGTPGTASGQVTFVPVSDEVRNGGGNTQTLPGLELPVLLMVVLLAVLVSRRR